MIAACTSLESTCVLQFKELLDRASAKDLIIAKVIKHPMDVNDRLVIEIRYLLSLNVYFFRSNVHFFIINIYFLKDNCILRRPTAACN